MHIARRVGRGGRGWQHELSLNLHLHLKSRVSFACRGLAGVELPTNWLDLPVLLKQLPILECLCLISSSSKSTSKSSCSWDRVIRSRLISLNSERSCTILSLSSKRAVVSWRSLSCSTIRACCYRTYSVRCARLETCIFMISALLCW